MASIALSLLVMCISCFVLFCFVLLSCVCVAMVWTIWSVLGVYFIFLVHCSFIFVSSPSSSGDMKGLLGRFSRCDHIYRVQVKGHGGVSSTFKTMPGFRPQVGLLVGKFIAYTRIYTAGKLGL